MQTQQVNFEKIAEGLYLLRLPFSGIWAGVYLHVGREVALIDSGPDAQGVDTYILPALRRLGLAPRDITLLLNTHTHGDHVGGHFRLKELCPCCVMRNSAIFFLTLAFFRDIRPET